jgi:hypothetical protein
MNDNTANETVYPDNVYERWQIRFPEEAEIDPDPRFLCGPCRDCGQTFAWRGYDGLCGWCAWFETFGDSSGVEER